jgi:anthranilate phosphoribosyltransferase
MTSFQPFLEHAVSGLPLNAEDAADAFGLLLEGKVSAVCMAAFLAALRTRGETADEIFGAASALRSHMLTVKAPADAVDVVGTGGDAKGTYNVSTCAAFVVAGAGVPVAKHGNRSVSSNCGAADVLEALGVKLDGGAEMAERALAGAGVAFLFAPAHHSAMRRVAPVRKDMGVRTIFNLIGPLSNPAGVKRALVGAYSEHWLEPMAEVMRRFGAEHMWLVHGAGGLDELSTLGETVVVELAGGKIRRFTVRPEDAGVKAASLEDIVGGGAEQNAAALAGVLAGDPGAYRDIVILNAAAALITAGKAATLAEGAAIAVQSIDSGRARQALAKLAEISQG